MLQTILLRAWYDEILSYVPGPIFIFIFFVYLILKALLTKSIKDYHSQWNTLIDEFKYSTLDFYTKLETELGSHGISGITYKKVKHRKGGIGSGKRLYLRVEWREFQYDICAAPFGGGFFVSWWLLYKTSFLQIIVSKIPFIGAWLARKWFPQTYYRMDTASMFQTYCHSSVQTVIDEITIESGIRSLSEDARKPILKDIFKR